MEAAAFVALTREPSFPRKRESRGGGRQKRRIPPPSPHMDSRFHGNDGPGDWRHFVREAF